MLDIQLFLNNRTTRSKQYRIKKLTQTQMLTNPFNTQKNFI